MRIVSLSVCCLVSVVMLAGCRAGPTRLPVDQQVPIDRSAVEYPAGSVLRPYITNLTAPTAIAWDTDGNLLIAEGGLGGQRPRVIGFQPDGTFFEIGHRRPTLPLPLGRAGADIHGPIGGMVAAHGRIYISHRDSQDRGMISALDYDGNYTTIVADLPAQGDYGVTDIAVAPNGRLYFGVGAATNSGVVGLDNMHWLQRNRALADQPSGEIYLLGRRFDTPNPFAGLFGGTDLAVTAPFQPFGTSIETRIPAAVNNKPNAAVFSVDPTGGDLRVEAHGVRNPVGLAFSDTGRLYLTNQGMKLRGTRPVKDDPDVMLRMVHGQWYGWPDFSANLLPIRLERFQPPMELIVQSGYRDLSFLIDHETSGLTPPNPQSPLLTAEFQALSGAAKLDFVPAAGPFAHLRQRGNVAVVALSGDRAPFDTSGMPLVGPTGYRVVLVNIDDHQVRDFVRNTQGGPLSAERQRRGHRLAGLERPFDVKFGPDGALYIVDLGEIEVRDGREIPRSGSGRIYRLEGLEE